MRATISDQELKKLLGEFRMDTLGGIKIRPSFSWLPVIIQVVSLIGIMGWAYGALDGRLKLIEYRLGQIESRIHTVGP